MKEFYAKLKNILRSLGPEYRKKINLSIVLMLVSTLFIAFIPFVAGRYIDYLRGCIESFGYTDPEAIVFYTSLMIMMPIAGYVTRTHSERTSIRVTLEFIGKMRERIDNTILRMPLKDLESRNMGNITSLLTSDVSNVTVLLSKSMTGIIMNTFMATILVIMGIVVCPQLSLVYIVTLPVLVFFTIKQTMKAYAANTEQKQYISDMNAMLMETVYSHRSIKADRLEDSMVEKFDEFNRRYTRASLEAGKGYAALEPVALFFVYLAYVLVAVFGVYMVLENILSLGSFVAFVSYIGMMAAPMKALSLSIGGMNSQIQSLDRILDLISIEQEFRVTDVEFDPCSVEGRLSVENLSLSRDGRPVLKDISFTVEPGEYVVVLGGSGSGKSTLFNTVTGFFEPDEGKVLIDGKDIAHISRKDLSACMGIVLNKPWIFEGTVVENIAYGTEGCTREKVVDVLNEMGMGDLFDSFPQGIDTVIGRKGFELPPAESKMIALARLKLKNPQIYVVDEAFSGIDILTGMNIHDSYRAVYGKKTLINFTYDIRRGAYADRIILLEKGRVVESGSHDELMLLNGKYAEMYHNTFGTK